MSSDSVPRQLWNLKSKVFCSVNKGVLWQAKFACLKTCKMCVMMVGGTVRLAYCSV